MKLDKKEIKLKKERKGKRFTDFLKKITMDVIVKITVEFVYRLMFL